MRAIITMLENTDDQWCSILVGLITQVKSSQVITQRTHGAHQRMKNDESSALKRRTELLEMSRELIKVMREVINPINQITCRLESEASALLPEAAEEQVHSGKKTPRGNADTDPTVPMPNEIPLPKGKRACSKCRKTGHKAPNCPN